MSSPNTCSSHSRLLTRDEFRAGVFARDAHKCVVCGAVADDAHHIIDRRLWNNGGYYLENGASVCESCHLRAEQTLISCDELRAMCGITKIVLPEHLYTDMEWDKWANPVMPDGTRLRGELFEDESVQKVLAPVLHLFERIRVKYPRTFHLPNSPGVGKDDRVIPDVSVFHGKRVVITEKVDGENTTMYRDGMHARSLTCEPHPSRDRVKAIHGAIAHEIPEGWRVCGENMFAQHSIHYTGLAGYFLGFSIWNAMNECLSWEDTVEWFALLELPIVPVIYVGPWEGQPRQIYTSHRDGHEMEGYVVRMADSFPYRDFRRSVAKYVRASHVQTHGGWMRQAVVPNELSAACR